SLRLDEVADRGSRHSAKNGSDRRRLDRNPGRDLRKDRAPIRASRFRSWLGRLAGLPAHARRHRSPVAGLRGAERLPLKISGCLSSQQEPLARLREGGCVASVVKEEVPMAQRQDFRRIGLLVPSSSSVQERDFCRALPEDITLHVARMRLSNVESESTLRSAQETEIGTQKLAEVAVDVIVSPATAPPAGNAMGSDQELNKRIRAARGKPSTTASTALLEALHVLSAKRI